MVSIKLNTGMGRSEPGLDYSGARLVRGRKRGSKVIAAVEYWNALGMCRFLVDFESLTV